MKMKLMIVTAVGLLMCSCSSVRHTSSVAPVDNAVYAFTVADLSVKPTKVSKTTSWGYKPFKRVSASTVKTNTTAALLQENNSDVLLEPQYIIEQRGFLRGGSVTVIGFPAKYENFHKMTPEEAELVKAVNTKEIAPTKRWFFF